MKNDPVHFIYIRRRISEMDEKELIDMQLDILEKLAIVCDLTDKISERWGDIPGGKNCYNFEITRVEPNSRISGK